MATPPESALTDVVSSEVSATTLIPHQNGRDVRSLAILPTDGELLMLFTEESDEAAFDRLIERHGSMVWRVCRGVLLTQQDVEDAYQATFMLLASKANQIRANDSAAGWLYRVAYRTALTAKRRAKQRREESLVAEPTAPPEEAFPNLIGRQMVSLLLEELRAMPKNYQTPLVMRYLEGQSRRAIADQTDTTVAAVQGKLARGKQLLRRRLVRRGVSLAAAMGVVGAASRSTEVASPTLIAQTAADCQALVTGSSSLAASSVVLALYQEGTRAMFIASMTKPAAAIAACSLAAALLIGGDAGGNEPTDSMPGGLNGFQLSAVLAADEDADESPAAMVQFVAELAVDSVTEKKPAIIAGEGGNFQPVQPNGEAREITGELVPGPIPQGMKFGDMGRDGKKLSDAEQSELLKNIWAERAAKTPDLLLTKEPSIKELHVQHTYWESRYDALKNKVATIVRLNDKPISELTAEQQLQLAEANLMSADIFHARAEALRLERELMLRATEESAGDKESSSPTSIPGKIVGSPSRPPIENGEEVELWPDGTKKAVREYRNGRLVGAVEYDESGNKTYVMEDKGPIVEVTGQNQSYQQQSYSLPSQQNQNRNVFLDWPTAQPQNHNNNQSVQNWGENDQTPSAPSQALSDPIERQTYAPQNRVQASNTKTIDQSPSEQLSLTPKRNLNESYNNSTSSVDKALAALKGMINVSAGECYSLEKVWDNITQRLDERFKSNEEDKKAHAEKVIDQLSGEELFILQDDLALLKSYDYSKRNLDRHLAASDELLHYWMALESHKDLLDSRDPNKTVYSPRVIVKAKLYIDQIKEIRANVERIEAKLPPQEVQNILAAAVKKNQDKIIHRQYSGSLEVKNFSDQQKKDFELLQKVQTSGQQVPRALDIIADIRGQYGNANSGSPNRPRTSSFKNLSELIRDYDDSVEELQGALNQQLDPSSELDVDGDYGPLTRAAVRKFQEEAKLTPTGFADEATREALGVKNKPLADEKENVNVDEARTKNVSKVNLEEAKDRPTGRSRLIRNRSDFNRSGWTILADAVVGNKVELPHMSLATPDIRHPFMLEIIEVGKAGCRFRVYQKGLDPSEEHYVLRSNLPRLDEFASGRVHSLWIDGEKEKSPFVVLRELDSLGGEIRHFGDTRLARHYLDNPNEVVPNPLPHRARYNLQPVLSTYKSEPNKESSLEPRPIEPTEKTVKVAKQDTQLSIEELNRRGWQSFNQGKNKEAEADFREILSRDKKYLAAINGLGFALLNQGNHQEAKPLFKSYLKRDKKAIGPMNGLARCLMAEGDSDGAIKVWEMGLKIAPGPNALSSGLAFAYLDKGEHAKAIPLFEMLLKSNPGNKFFSDALERAKAALPEQPNANENKAGSRSAEIPRIIARGDGKPDGKKSLGGSGHLVKFTLPDGVTHIRAVRLHGSRYGAKQAPREDFEISFLSEDRSEILAVEHAAYGLFRRGAEKWTTIRLANPIELPKTFWVALDFDPAQTKGIYLSYDTETGGTDSMIGLAQDEPTEHRPVNNGGDWMVSLLPVRD